jgi:adenine deaminase
VAERFATLVRSQRCIGSSAGDLFQALSFLALPVIPKLRLTDRGLVDVDRFEFVPLFAD